MPRTDLCALFLCRLKSIEGAADLIIAGGGYFSCHEEVGGEETALVYISDEDIENWRQTGEFT